MSTATITTRTRMEVQDTGRPFAATISVGGISTVFDLPVESISETASPPIVLLGGVQIFPSATPQLSIDYKHGILVFPAGSPPGPSGTLLAIQGITYDFFDDDEVSQAVVDAFDLHVNDQNPLPTIDPVLGQPSISSEEEYLVGILAAIELLWWRSNDSSQLIDITTPEGVHIPASQRFEQISRQLALLQQRYEHYSNAIGVGAFRIQIMWQRRVSYTTNRLVPLFQEQEYNQPYTGFNPTAAPVGATVQIFGKYLTNTTQITFGGVPAQTFTVISDTEVDAVVPPNAQTGQIGIVTPGGAVLSTAQFVVGQPAPAISYGPNFLTPEIPAGV